MIRIRKSNERGFADHGWLKAFHTFSFADYRDPQHDHFRSLRVMNEDRVAPSQGFGLHPHRDMEIITYILSGELEHKDSMGNGEVLRAGDVQRMSAGTGVLHSEFNPSATEPVHLYQIWLIPEQRGLTPSYEQRSFQVQQRKNRLQLIASREKNDDSMQIHQDALVYLAALDPKQSIEHRLADGRYAWLQVVRGAIAIGGHQLSAGDGAAIENESTISLQALDDSEVLLFDLA